MIVFYNQIVMQYHGTCQGQPKITRTSWVQFPHVISNFIYMNFQHLENDFCFVYHASATCCYLFVAPKVQKRIKGQTFHISTMKSIASSLFFRVYCYFQEIDMFILLLVQKVNKINLIAMERTVHNEQFPNLYLQLYLFQQIHLHA